MGARAAPTRGPRRTGDLVAEERSDSCASAEIDALSSDAMREFARYREVLERGPLEPWPGVPTRFVLCTEDRFFTPGFLRAVVADRRGIRPVEIAAGHCVALSRPDELVSLLVQP